MCNTKNRGVYLCEVVSNTQLCDEHYRLAVAVDESAKKFPPCSAGQFVQVQCRPPASQSSAIVNDWQEADGWPEVHQPELLGTEPLLRRPISLAGRREENGRTILEMIYRVVGTGTTWLSGINAGDKVSVIGPLGNALPIIEKPRAILIGGGVGIPPMIYMSEMLKQAGKEVVAFCGVRNESLLPLEPTTEQPCPGACAKMCYREFADHNTPCVIASDDGSVGFHGLVTQAVVKFLEQSGWASDEIVAYSCGPEPMMRALGEVCIARDIECYLSLERHMACGMGTCQSCIVKIADNSEQGWNYKLCCTHGPVFNAQDVVWE